MNEEKFSCWAIDFWEKNKELDSLHLLNKFMEEKYFPLDNKLKEVREYIEKNTKWYDKELGLVEMKGYKTNRIPVIYLYGLLRILDKEDKMIDLENKIERDKLIDDYFNKGYACDIREVYQAVVNTIADLEYANDEKVKEIERLNKMLDEKFMKENTFLVENGIICTKNKEIERLNRENEELKHKLKLRSSYVYGCDIDSLGSDK